MPDRRWLAAAAILSLWSADGFGAPLAPQWRPPVRMEAHLFVRAAVLGVRRNEARTLAEAVLQVAPGSSASRAFDLEFASTGERVSELRLSVSGAGLPGERLQLNVESAILVHKAGRDPLVLKRERSAVLVEGGSLLHQAYENPHLETSVILTLTPEIRVIPTVGPAVGGSAVSFRISLFRLTPAGPLPVEDNVIRTLEGASASYAFRARIGDGRADSASEPGDRLDAGSKISPGAAGPGSSSLAPAGPPPASVSSGEAGEEGDSDGGESSTRSDRDTTSDPRGRAYEELELILSPRRRSGSILIVDAVLQRRYAATPGAPERTSTVERTQAVSRGESFELRIGAPEIDPDAAYLFVVKVEY